MPVSKNTQKGFTLIELLIVIVIIGILAGILVAVVDIKEYQRQARDVRRLNDVLAVQTALVNSIATSNISLTDTTGCGDCDSVNGSTEIYGNGWVKFNDLKGRGLVDIISVLPKDPVNDATYHFEYYSDGLDFELNAVFESTRYQTNAQDDGGNDPDVYEKGFNLNLN